MSRENVTMSQIRFGQALRSFMERTNMTQTELAAKAGLQRTVISEIVNFHRDPGLKTRERIASAFGVDLVEFLREEQESESSRRQTQSSLGSISNRLPKMPTWLENILPKMLTLDENGQKAVKAIVEAFKRD